MSEDKPKLSASERARRYLEKVPAAVEGSNGDDSTYSAAKALVVGFDLPADVAWPIFTDWNLRCDPPWPENDLRRKLQQAEKYKAKNSAGVGKLLGCSYHEHEERLRAGGSPKKTRKKKTWSPRIRTSERRRVVEPLSDSEERPQVPTGKGKTVIEMPSFSADSEVSPEDPEPHAPTITEEASSAAIEGCPIIAIYGGQKALWTAIKEQLRKTITAANKEVGRTCRLPTAVRLDRRVTGKLPASIDTFKVIPDEREGVIEFDWEGSPK